MTNPTDTTEAINPPAAPAVEPEERVLTPLQAALVLVGIPAVIVLLAGIIAFFLKDDPAPASEPSRAQQALIIAGFTEPELVETAEQVTARNHREMSTDIVRDTYQVTLGNCPNTRVTMDGDTVIWRDFIGATVIEIQKNARDWGVDHCFTELQSAPARR